MEEQQSQLGPLAGLFQDRRVLLVDDDPAILQTIGDLLTHMGCVVLTAQNGEEALNLFREHPLDLLLSDVRMPVMDGLQLLSAVKDIDPAVPVVLLSGYDETEIVVEALRQGAEYFLAKPFSPQELARVLDLALDRRVSLSLAQSRGATIGQVTTVEAPSIAEHIKPLVALVTASAVTAGFARNRLDNSIGLALVEGLTNAMEHGSKWDPDSFIKVKVTAASERLEVTISDQGAGFKWQDLPDPTDINNLLLERGRGVFLMRTVMDEVNYNPKGNVVTLIKRNPGC